MKISIPLTIVAIICIMALEQIEAFNSTFSVFVFFSQCKVWATDNSDKTVIDTGWMNCEDGDLHAKVMCSKRKAKHRGPFSSDTCFKFKGSVDIWHFDQKVLIEHGKEHKSFMVILRSLSIWPIHSNEKGGKFIDTSGNLLTYRLPFFSFHKNTDFYRCDDESDFKRLLNYAKNTY